ncbi:hypothetical protein HHK36_017835 [Tetracentron sinense]|uniref:Uncharacterized protein n=1 Tax=Tetracentron sinense TaxID=13715 RepID=A0A834Z0D8_TETSI|nr:hypothetical protein HHK36_017835 [Tetracentron sinense]
MFKAQILHASLFKNGIQNDVYRCNLLLQAYIKSGALSDAQKLLHLMPHPNVVSFNTLLSGFFNSRLLHQALQFFALSPISDSQSWNILISGCIHNQRPKEAMTHFVQMRHSSFRPDNFTYATVIPCCDYQIGRQIHAEIIKVCSNSDAFLGTNLLRLYAEVGEMGDARKVFDEMPNRDLITWNALISCYSKYGMGEVSMELFRQLVREGIFADEFTYAIVLNEFASRLQVFEAMMVHSLIIRSGFCSDRFISNALVNLYSKCGFVASAARLFEEIPERDVVSWTAMIVGMSQSGNVKDAVWLFVQMRLSGLEPNSFTFGGLLCAFASANAFERGKQFHGLVLKFGLETNVVVGSAIVDMYTKCGEMNDALGFFERMPERDIVSWNGMICGFAQNGEAMKALELFNEMMQLGSTGIFPNHITFVGVLSACSDGGLLNEGRCYFNDMIHKYLIEPKPEHYTCMVDILARAGLLDEAEALILTLPFKPDSVMWTVLLGACKLHRNLRMAKRVSKQLYADEPKNSSNYVLLANTYTDNGEWGDAVKVREAMVARGAQKMTECSRIEIRNCFHSFVAGDRYHPQIELVSEVLQRLCMQMEERND